MADATGQGGGDEPAAAERGGHARPNMSVAVGNETLRDAVQALVHALGLMSSNALWETAKVNKNDWNDRLRPYTHKTTGKKQIDRLIDNLASNLGASHEQREVLGAYRLRLYHAIGMNPGFLSHQDESRGATAVDSTAPETPLAALLAQVKEFWVDAVLARSNAAELIELRKVKLQDAVEPPWRMPLPGVPSVSDDVNGPAGVVFKHANYELLILGAAGSGKTTMLLELARDAANAVDRDVSKPVPVMLLLSSWSPDYATFADWLISEINLRYHTSTRLAQNWLIDGNLILLLDGLDELPTQLRGACVQAVNSFRRDGYGHVHLALTCRAEAYQALPVCLQLSMAVMLEPLSDAQLASYIRTLGTHGQPLKTAIEQDVSLAELARTPLMLSLLRWSTDSKAIAGANDSGGGASVPTDIGSIREQVFAKFLGYSYQRHGHGRGYSWSETLRYLGWLARSTSVRGGSLFVLEDIQPSWLPNLWSRLCTLLLGTMVGLCLTTPAIVLSFLWLGNVVPALSWAVTFWLVWALRAVQRSKIDNVWSTGDVARVVLPCLGGALILRALLLPMSKWSLAELAKPSLQLGLILSVAWGLTWLVHSRELLRAAQPTWWRRRWLGLSVSVLLVVAPLALVFPDEGWLDRAHEFGWWLLPAAAGLGILLGLGAGGACLPFWMVNNWRRVLPLSAIVVASCFATVVGIGLITDPAPVLQPHVVSNPAIFFGFVFGVLIILQMGLRRRDTSVSPRDQMARSDRIIAFVIFGTCLEFIPNSGTLAMMLAISLALSLDPGAIRPVKRFRPTWRLAAALYLCGPVLTFFIQEAGQLVAPTTSLTVAGIDALSSHVQSLSATLVVALLAGIGASTVLIIAVGFEAVEEPRPEVPYQNLYRSVQHSIVILVAAGGVALVLWAAVHAMNVPWPGLRDPRLVIGVTLIVAVAVIYAGLVKGGAFVINHTMVRYLLRRLDLVPDDLVGFLGICVDMMILQRVGGGFQFVHSLLVEHLVHVNSPTR